MATSFSTPSVYADALEEANYFLPLFLFSVYSTLYFILPQYLKRRKLLSVGLHAFILILITSVLGYLLAQSFFLRHIPADWNQLDIITLAIGKCVEMQIVITGVAVIVKTMKDYYLKQKEHERLAVKNISNRLQILKMQIHPRILFESLHNIYKDIDKGALNAPEMILKLSDLLSYLLYEGQAKEVTLDKELKMVQNYIDLKKLEYKNKLRTKIEIDESLPTHKVATGFFLPLLEIALHSLGKIKKVSLLSIQCKIRASVLYFNLEIITNENKVVDLSSAKSIINNLERRLQLSHSRKSKLQIGSLAGNFTIQLQIELDTPLDHEIPNTQNHESLIYEHA